MSTSTNATGRYSSPVKGRADATVRDPQERTGPIRLRPRSAPGPTGITGAGARLAPGADLRQLAGLAGNRAVAGLLTVSREPAGTATPETGRWVDPDGRVITGTVGASIRLLALRQEAEELQTSGVGDFALAVEEANARIAALSAGGADRALTATEASGLTAFSQEFAQQRQAAVRAVAQAIIGQLSDWLNRPISDDDLFDLREYVHKAFVSTTNTDAITQATKLLSDAKETVDEVETWSGRAAKAADWLGTAKRLADVHAAVESISKYVGTATKFTTLARNVGRMTGTLGGTPAGTDDVLAMEGAIGTIDFVISMGKVPGLDQLWGGYISKAAKACLAALRSLKDVLYTKDRHEGVALFFAQHRNDPVAPQISEALVHGVETGRHFPGGQAMLDFMWRLMQAPDSVVAVPSGIEDFFVKWRKQMGAGVEGEKIRTDASWSNLWNAFGRDESPNLVPWLRAHRGDAWVKLYGGMPPPG